MRCRNWLRKTAMFSPFHAKKRVCVTRDRLIAAKQFVMHYEMKCIVRGKSVNFLENVIDIASEAKFHRFPEGQKVTFILFDKLTRRFFFRKETWNLTLSVWLIKTFQVSSTFTIKSHLYIFASSLLFKLLTLLVMVWEK